MAEAGRPIEAGPNQPLGKEQGVRVEKKPETPSRKTEKPPDESSQRETQAEIEHARRELKEEEKVEPLRLSKTSYDLINDASEEMAIRLDGNVKDFGITPSPGENGVYSGRVFGRDAGRAAGYFSEVNSQAVTDSLATILRYQRADGALPAGVEKDYLPLRELGLNSLAKTAFRLIEGRFKGRTERPVYAGKTWYGEEDAIPTIIIAAGEFFNNSPEGRQLLEANGGENYEKLKKAVEFTKHKVNPGDGLIKCQENGPDWQNSINRGGELTGVNILWARSLQQMETVARALGHTEDAEGFAADYQRVKESILAKTYSKEGGYFMASTTDPRLDTFASIEGALYLLDVQDAVKVEDTLTQRVTRKAGLVNFDPPYPDSQIKLWHKIQGITDYHNKGSWPWITCENVLVKIRIGQEHPDREVREGYVVGAVEDLRKVASMFKDAGGAYEFFDADTAKPGGEGSRYHTPENFISSMTMFNLAYARVKEAGWVDKSEQQEKPVEIAK